MIDIDKNIIFVEKIAQYVVILLQLMWNMGLIFIHKMDIGDMQDVLNFNLN